MEQATASPAWRPLVVGIGGTTLPGSSTERAVAIALRAAADHGMETRLFGGAELAALPLYIPHQITHLPAEQGLVDAVRAASGLVIASPGCHGSVSGLVQNAIDLIEETARDARPYLTDLPVGLIATAYGWQATGSTIAAPRPGGGGGTAPRRSGGRRSGSWPPTASSCCSAWASTRSSSGREAGGCPSWQARCLSA